MDWERFTNDQVEELLIAAERKESEGRALKMEALEVLDRRQVFTADGSRNLSEWYAARADVGLDTARSVVTTMRRTSNKPWLREVLAAGAVSFDRAEALSHIPENVGTMSHLDVAGLRRAAADLVEISSEAEVRSAEDQFFVMQPSLDESWWKTWGGLDGPTGAVLDRVLTEKADQLPDLPDGTRGSPAWRRAIALGELATGGGSPRAQITVFVDADKAAAANGQTGIRLEAGPRVGAQALSAILCDSVTEVTVNTADGVPMSYGRRTRPVPPALRRATLARNHGYCQTDGCNSRYRVEVHHKVPWSLGGGTDPENLVALCWFHHQIVVHQRGFQLFEDPDTGRIRFRKPKHYEQDPEFELVGAGRKPEG